DCRCTNNGSRLTNTFDTDWMMRRGRYRMVKFNLREHIGARHTVVQHRASEQLPILVINDAFTECLPNALDDATVNLPGNNRRIDLRAAVVHRDIAFKLYLSGLTIYLDNGDMRTKRISEVGWIIELGLFEAGIHTFQQIPN